jgi:hypothetical protein
MRLASASAFALGFVDVADDDGCGGSSGAALSHLLFNAAIRSAIDITFGSESSSPIMKCCLGASGGFDVATYYCCGGGNKMSMAAGAAKRFAQTMASSRQNNIVDVELDCRIPHR